MTKFKDTDQCITHARTHTCTHTHVHAHTFTHMHTHTHACTHTHTYAHARAQHTRTHFRIHSQNWLHGPIQGMSQQKATRPVSCWQQGYHSNLPSCIALSVQWSTHPFRLANSMRWERWGIQLWAISSKYLFILNFSPQDPLHYTQ